MDKDDKRKLWGDLRQLVEKGLTGKIKEDRRLLDREVEPGAQGLDSEVEPGEQRLDSEVEPGAQGLDRMVEPGAQGLDREVEPRDWGNRDARVRPGRLGIPLSPHPSDTPRTWCSAVCVAGIPLSSASHGDACDNWNANPMGVETSATQFTTLLPAPRNGLDTIPHSMSLHDLTKHSIPATFKAKAEAMSTWTLLSSHLQVLSLLLTPRLKS